MEYHVRQTLNIICWSEAIASDSQTFCNVKYHTRMTHIMPIKYCFLKTYYLLDK